MGKNDLGVYRVCMVL
jgi:formyltetrahydrofolate hydrolase